MSRTASTISGVAVVSGVARELAAIAHQRLALARGEVVVVVEVDRGRREAVERAARRAGSG
jgi:hypothetical protein